jgi:tRNA(Ile2) C34 agmatinyltransferase TiaS
VTDTRRCKKCGRDLPSAAFYQPPPDRSNGVIYPRSTCRDCVRFRDAMRRMKPQPVTGQRRVCKACGVEKPLADFYMTSSGRRNWTCKPCRNRLDTERIQAQRTNDPAAYAEYLARKAATLKRRRIRQAIQKVLPNAEAQS